MKTYNDIKGAGGGKGGDSARTPVEAPNTLQSVNTIRLVDVISEGEIEGLVNGLESVFFDDTRLKNPSAFFNSDQISAIGPEVFNAPSGTQATHDTKTYQFTAPHNLSLIPGKQINVSGFSASNNNGLHTIVSSNSSSITVAEGLTTEDDNDVVVNSDPQAYLLPSGHGQAYSLNQSIIVSGFSNGTNNGNKIVFSLFGDFLSLTTSLVDEALGNDIVIETPSFNFNGIEISERIGSPVQDHVPGVAEIETEINVNAEVLFATPVVRTITDAQVDAVRIKIRLDGLSFRSLTSGDLNGTSVFFAFDVQDDGGGFVEVKSTSIVGKTTSRYERAYRLELTKGGNPWDIRVRRITPDSTNSLLINSTFFQAYTEITDVKLSYPDTALIALTASAEQFGGSVPRRGYEIKGIKLQIPTNYDPVTRIYTGMWDGTFKTEFSDNPAWVLYDLLVEKRYGLGNNIDTSVVDKFALFDIAQFCDVLVDDGFGGQEPRYVFNGVINSQTDAYGVLNSIVSVFHGMIFWASGTIDFSIDKNSDPVKLVSPSNVIDGVFNYSGSALKDRHSAISVTWNDPEDGYKAVVEVVEDPELIQDFGFKSLDVVAYGTTSQGQAARFGRWVLDSEKFEPERVTYQASMDHVDIRPGDIISINDDAFAGVRFGGRIVARTTGSVTIDAPIELEVAETYSISVVIPSGGIVTKNITNVAGTDITVLTIDIVFSVLPDTNAMWSINASNVAARPFRVLSITESAKNLYDISAIFHDVNKFSRIEDGLVLEEIVFNILPTGILPVITAIDTKEFLFKDGAAVLSGAVFSWAFPDDPRVAFFESQIKLPGEVSFTIIKTTSSPTTDLFNIQAGTYGLKVRVLDSLGATGDFFETNIDIQGLGAPPSDVENFTIQVVSGNAILTWDIVTDLDLDFYTLRYSNLLSGATWETAQVIVKQTKETQVTTPAFVGTYFIKAVDLSGVESVNAALIVSEIIGLVGFNVVEQIQEQPLFEGIKTNLTVIGTILQLQESDVMADWTPLSSAIPLASGGFSPTGLYEFFNTVDLGSVFSSRLTTVIEAVGFDVQTGFESSEWDVTIEVRTTNDDPSGSPVFTPFEPLVVGDYTARAFEFRLQVESFNPAVTVQISRLEVTIDMPDRLAGGDNLTCPIGGITINYDPAFNALPAVVPDGQDLDTGDYHRITLKTVSGFKIEFFDSGDSSISRTFDFLARGYGFEGG